MLKEFKQFIARGNVVDLAVGVIVGGAFGKIVTSLVNDLMMPVIGIVSGGIDFTDLVLKVGEAEIKYGSFIQNVIDFLIIAACVFIFVKFVNGLSKPKKEEKPKEVKKPDDIVLLEEIRDLLKKETKTTKTTKTVKAKK